MKLKKTWLGCSLLAMQACAGVPVAPHVPRVSTFQEAHGQRLFVENCQRCHPGGEQGVGPSLLKTYHSATVIRAQVRQGIGVMPSFSHRRLHDEELDAVIAYVHFLESRAGACTGQ
jgi:mono/diheme cytochrome c family protein